MLPGGQRRVEALNLWGAATKSAGRLPAEKEMVSQLRQAGFGPVKCRNLLPGDCFMSFQAYCLWLFSEVCHILFRGYVQGDATDVFLLDV